MNRIAATDPMRLETDRDDIVDMYLTELTITEPKA
jgi:hypothetical protein